MNEELIVSLDLGQVEMAGSAMTFETFFLEEYEGVYGSLCLITRNRHEAEEIAQDAFTKMWERWDQLGSIDDPVAYVHSVAMNAFRRRSRRAKMALRRTLRLIPSDDLLATVEEHESVVRLLAPLSPRQRAAIVLTDLLDYTSEEAAEMLGMRPGAVRSLASRGRAELRRLGGIGSHEADEG
jgi:RNA polymerase sigma factor (sigma-70 family)